MLGGTQRRIEGAFYLFLLPLLFFAGRLIQLQAFGRSQVATTPATPVIFSKTEILKPRRAQILAADGTAMAVTLEEFNVCANPRAVREKPKMARLIAQALGGDESQYLTLLQKTTKQDGTPNRYVRLAKRVDENRIDKLRALMGPKEKGKDKKSESRKTRKLRQEFWTPITLEPSPRRHYPLGSFASQLIGFTTNVGQGADGIEKAWDTELGGKSGERISQVDARARPIPGFVSRYTPPTPGRAVVTTIDPTIQAAADEVLNELVKKYKPHFASALVMRPKTGELVAISTAPTYDLNHKPANIIDVATDRCLDFGYEPGSTFKIITAAAAVESIPNWQSISFDVPTGAEKVGRHIIHDWDFWSGRHKSGSKTLSEGIRDSSNITMWHFAHLMGAPTMLEYAQKFHIGEAVGIDKLHEYPGLLPKNPPSQWSGEQLANFSFGQGMLLTPLQLMRVAGTVANDGIMMKPMLIKELRDESGKTIREWKPQSMGRVIESETAREVTKMMMRVMSEGTARKHVFIPGYRAAGKTGSAQKANGKKGYAEGRFISSLIGFVPAQEPEFVILVLADEPRGSHWGSEVCGPAFNTIANRVMLRLRLLEGAAAPAPDPNLMVQPKDPKQKT